VTEIRFYHLQKSRLESALPQLLQKVLEKGWRAVVQVGSMERAEALNQQLWTYDDASFLPHGSSKDGHAELQPIWLTAAEERPNNAEVLMLVDGASANNLSPYQLTCEIFDGNDPEALSAARIRWKAYQTAGYTLTYWQQTERGWEQKSN
jgi:DNA polymerase III subunit chi